jgi:uncharacterized protein YjiS (DUF1127 family)
MREGQSIAPAAGEQAIVLDFPLVRLPRNPEPADAPHGVRGLLRLWYRRWRQRREMRDLAIFEPDSVLADIGIDRKEAWRRARTPFWRP